MRYQVILRPILPVLGAQPAGVAAIGADGVSVPVIVAGEVASPTGVQNFIIAPRQIKIAATSLVNSPAIDISADQTAALQVYFAAIQAGTDTSAVETAINAL